VVSMVPEAAAARHTIAEGHPRESHVTIQGYIWAWAARPDGPTRPGPKMARPDLLFWPDGPGLGREIWPDWLVRPGLGRRFGRFWEGPARRPDSPMFFWPDGPGLGSKTRPDSRAGPGQGSRFLSRAFYRPGPARKHAQVYPRVSVVLLLASWWCNIQ
jgi:hypothetical protein